VTTAGSSRREVEALEEKLEEETCAKAEAEGELARCKADADALRADLARLRAQAQNQSACCGVS
jgi:predicted nuclease with TOPRIM domain